MSRSTLALFLLFVSSVHAQEKSQQVGHVLKLDAALDKLIDSSSTCEVLSSGYRWSEGPVWLSKQSALLFSDVPNNVIHRWTQSGGVSVHMKRSGADGSDGQPGSNGLFLDPYGRLTVCDHGNRRVYRVESDGTKTTIAKTFENRRFNSPNDLVYHSNGDLYFTDPPYGLTDETLRELDWCGVYRVRPGEVAELLTKELSRPNGIALSPNEKTLYVSQSDPEKAIYVAFSLNKDGTLGASRTLFDATKWVADDPGLPDGMAIDQSGNLWATGPGGVLILTPSGTLLGRIMTGTATANCTFGEDGSTLFLTAGSRLLRIRTKARGLGFDAPAPN